MFPAKRYVFVSARVHPGETGASFMWAAAAAAAAAAASVVAVLVVAITADYLRDAFSPHSLVTPCARWDGLMTFLLSDDVRARLLRQHFVFKARLPLIFIAKTPL